MGRNIPKRNNLLIVDDEPEIRDVMGLLLSEEGFRVRTAADGAEALISIQENAPDLIILDMNMPKMGGVVFYHNIANSYDGSPKYPVIVLTARGDLESVFQDFQVDDFITKPFQYDDLVERITKVLDNRYGEKKKGPVSPAIQVKPAERTKKNPKALVCDSDHERFDAVVLNFMNAGYEVISAKNEKLAVRSASLDGPHVIFIGIKDFSSQSPQLSLAQALRSIEKTRGLPIVFYPAGSGRISDVLFERFLSSISKSSYVPVGDADLLLREFEKHCRDE